MENNFYNQNENNSKNEIKIFNINDKVNYNNENNKILIKFKYLNKKLKTVDNEVRIKKRLMATSYNDRIQNKNLNNI